MTSGGVSETSGDENINVTLQKMLEVEKERVSELRNEQTDSEMGFLMEIEELAQPFIHEFQKKRKGLDAHKDRVQELLKKEAKGLRSGMSSEKMKELAQEFQGKNPELRSPSLLLLRENLKEGSSKEEILQQVLEMFPDPTLADEALDFLIATTDGELQTTLVGIKEEFGEENAREIKAGRNIVEQARVASEKGLGTPTSLREMYRDITGNPREPATLFEELSQKYAYKDLKKVIDFLLHSLGADLKSKGPSIPKGLLHRLFTETRSLQAILGIYRFFSTRMRLVNNLFERNGLPVPPQMTFESMSKQFMNLVNDRYPSSDKVTQSAGRLGLDKWILAKIIAISQFRDAIREVAMNLIFRSVQHRDELFLAILESLEDLEDELEEEESDDDDENDEEEEESEE